LQQLDLGGRRFESQEQVHIDRAQSENLALERGARVMPAPWENHIIHVEQHERHLAENPTLPPQAVAQIWAHVAATRLALLQQFAPPAGMPVMSNAPAPYPQRPQPKETNGNRP